MGHIMFSPGAGADKDRIVYAEDGLKRESSAPCQLNCPAEIDVPSYIALIGKGKYDEAIEQIRKDNPFPWVCGLVCTNPCEAWCQRRYLDKALCIKDLKGLAAKMVMEKGTGYRIPEPRNAFQEKVAVIGSGPAGLTAAYFLAWEGYKVTIFELMKEPGGLMIAGIPEFRLPRTIVRREIEAITAMGVEIATDTPVGTDLTLDHLRANGYKAFFLGIGAWQGYRLGIEGENDYPQVISALQFLKDVSFGLKIKPADKVAIVGGGNAAVDAARTCIRLGSQSVSIVYRRTRSEMPAHFEEIIQMAEEGIHVHQLTIPAKILGNYGKVDFLECVMATLGEPDPSGRRRPVPIEGSEYKMPVGAIITAIGQRPDIEAFPGLGEMELTKQQTIKVASYNQQTSLPDVFAGGDAVTGPATVVQAIGAGKRAARAIHAYLRSQASPEKLLPRPHSMVAPTPMDYREKAFIQRQEIPMIDLDRRIHTFDQVELGLDEIAAKQEAKRCMRCDICERCGKCVDVCKDKLGVSAIRFHHAGESSLILKDYVHGLPKCIGCGSCVNICPTGALQMIDRGDERLLLMCGTVINRIKMEQCHGCGAYYLPKIFVKHVEKYLEDMPHAYNDKLCPECRKIAHAARMSGTEPNYDIATSLESMSADGVQQHAKLLWLQVGGPNKT
ncbi:MAG TPA: FAD-dependent oxidoreductase [Desulfomonilaceae bacterium]|nr:FAD-dependent oxidoreductase [Desulfomonilaceae bacterium]